MQRSEEQSEPISLMRRCTSPYVWSAGSPKDPLVNVRLYSNALGGTRRCSTLIVHIIFCWFLQLYISGVESLDAWST